MEHSRKPTPGEKLVGELLRKLPKNQYFVVTEPRIDAPGGTLRPDFVVVSGLYGVLVIEVKDYVEILEGSTQKTLRVRSRSKGVLTLENPEETSLRYAHALADKFKEFEELMHLWQGQKRLIFPYQNVVALPNISKSEISYLEKQGIFSRGIVWSRQTFQSVETLKAAIEALPWRFKPTRPLDYPVLNTLRGVLDPHLVIRDQNKRPIGFLSVSQEILTKEAIEAAESSTVRLVRGVAGSGKSLVLIHRVHYLAETYPELSVLAITFNKHLAERLRARIEIELPQVEVSTFHQLCVRVIKDSGEAWHSPIRRDGFLQGYVRDTRAAQALGVEFLDAEIGWRKDVGLLDNTAYLAAERKGRGKALDRNGRAIVNAAWDAYRDYQNRLAISRQAWRDWEDVGSEALRLLEKTDHRLKHSYDVILIDEAQDFAPVWIQTIKYLLKPNGTLFICDDPTQSIFRQYSWEEKGVSVRGRTKLLTVPYRCTRQITELAYSVIQHDSVLKQMADEIVSPNIDSPFVLSGDVPHLAPCRNEAETVARTHDYVEEWAGRGVAYEQIAVLCPSKAVVKYFAELREKGVYVENFEKVKGLEFQAVVIPFLCRAFGREGEQHNDEEISHKRRMLFTAMTRARILLAMTHQGALPPMLESIRPYVFIRV
jgi:thymidine kinase